MVISSRDRWLLAGLAAFALVLVVWRYVHVPLAEKLQGVHQELDKAEIDLRKAQTALKQEGDQAQRRERVAQLQQQLAALVPGRESARYFVYYLDQAQKTSGARIHKLTMEKPVKSGELVDIPVKLTVSGMFASHVMLDQSLERMPVFTATHSFTLKGNDASWQDASGPLIGWFDVQGEYTLHLYFQPVAGPDTPLRFDSAPGRADPFSYAGVADFVEEVQSSFPGGGEAVPPAQLG